MNERNTILTMSMLLEQLLRSPQPYALTNAAMLEIVSEFSERLVRSAERDRTMVQAYLWSRRIPGFQAEMIGSAYNDIIIGRQSELRLPLVEESRVKEFIRRICPDGPDFE